MQFHPVWIQSSVCPVQFPASIPCGRGGKALAVPEAQVDRPDAVPGSHSHPQSSHAWSKGWGNFPLSEERSAWLSGFPFFINWRVLFFSHPEAKRKGESSPNCTAVALGLRVSQSQCSQCETQYRTPENDALSHGASQPKSSVRCPGEGLQPPGSSRRGNHRVWPACSPLCSGGKYGLPQDYCSMP